MRRTLDLSGIYHKVDDLLLAKLLHEPRFQALQVPCNARPPACPHTKPQAWQCGLKSSSLHFQTLSLEGCSALTAASVSVIKCTLSRSLHTLKLTGCCHISPEVFVDVSVKCLLGGCAL